MKKMWLVLLCTLLLGLAPSTFADDSSGFGGFDALLAQLVAFFSGSSEVPTVLEAGPYFPPGGDSDSGAVLETGEHFPPGGVVDSGGVLETGEYFPPGGVLDSGEVLETGGYFPPGG